MRTLKLTHEEIATIEHALGMALNTIAQIIKQHNDNLCRTIGSDNHKEGNNINSLLLEYKNKFHNLSMQIHHGEKDI